MTRRRRLLNVVVQPVFVVEGLDGELEEQRLSPLSRRRGMADVRDNRFEEGTRAPRAQLDAEE